MLAGACSWHMRQEECAGKWTAYMHVRAGLGAPFALSGDTAHCVSLQKQPPQHPCRTRRVSTGRQLGQLHRARGRWPAPRRRQRLAWEGPVCWARWGPSAPNPRATPLIPPGCRILFHVHVQLLNAVLSRNTPYSVRVPAFLVPSENRDR